MGFLFLIFIEYFITFAHAYPILKYQLLIVQQKVFTYYPGLKLSGNTVQFFGNIWISEITFKDNVAKFHSGLFPNSDWKYLELIHKKLTSTFFTNSIFVIQQASKSCWHFFLIFGFLNTDIYTNNYIRFLWAAIF